VSRKEQIEAMLVEDPQDDFLRYSLAMELAKEGDSEKSLELFKELYTGSPPHVPSFFMAAQQLAKLGEINESRAILRNGIDAAHAQGDTHAAAEMGEFLSDLGELGE
jgi:tetratricopeptide (TPR) repeat protein